VSPCKDGTFLSRDGTFLAERGSESALFYSRFATNDDKLGTIVNQKDFKSMSTDELWALHEEVVARLATSLLAEKRLLEDRLKQLKGVQAERTKSSTGRRPYPTVVPKFRNPDRPSETWAGRGKTPRWLAAKLKSGKRIDDFRIRKVA
jgi:DNA-binding protein H-NS